NVLKTQGQLREAMACFERAVALDPDDADTLAAWFREKQNICDWSGYRENEARVRQAIGTQSSVNAPLTLLGLSSSPEEQLACARRVAAKMAAPADAFSRARSSAGERIR